MNIANLRSTYRLATLSESDVDADPIVQFDGWLKEAIASAALEATAMSLGTVDAAGRPSVRVVLLKGLDVESASANATGRGFVWFTNYQSRKGHELASHDRAALCFFWAELERQVRVEGRVEITSVEESDRYFASRPIASRIGAWASPQSEIVASRSDLEAREREVRERYSVTNDTAHSSTNINVPRPPHWGGYRLVPDRIEFWQGRPSRLHDRIVYRRTGEDNADSWTISRLAP